MEERGAEEGKVLAVWEGGRERGGGGVWGRVGGGVAVTMFCPQVNL